MKLVIVESPTKAKTIEHYLGKDYKVLASFGHIRDLVTNKYNDLGVDIENNFTPHYEISSNSKKVVNNLKEKAKEASEVLLATDPDREGESISWHLADVLNLNIKNTKRLEFHEVTKKAILDAVNNPRTIDMNLVQSQEARRILDRIIGFRLSGLVQNKFNARSAGRVQSVALKLIVDREKQIENFLKEVSYTIDLKYLKDKKEYKAWLVNEKNEILKDKDQAKIEKILEEISSDLKVIDVQEEEKSNYSLYPLTTSTLQQEAFTHYRYKATKTMKIAQELYEGIELDGNRLGLITYMRTDSIRLSSKYTFAAREYILENFGVEYAGYAKTQKENDNVQDAHEAIRPTDIKIIPSEVKDKLTKDQYNIYNLIWIRALCSVMSPEKIKIKKVFFETNGYRFVSEGKETLFDGYKKVYQGLVKSKYESLPDLKIDEILKITKKELKTEETKPPYRYSEASLIKAMEDEGIGRPSTYASTIEALYKSLYIVDENKYLKPTPIAILVNDRLQDYFKDFINVKYTANMEKELDQIADGKVDKIDYLKKSYDDFEDLYEDAISQMKKEGIMLEEKCPLCGGQLRISRSKYGEFISCSNYPLCSYTKNKEVEVPKNSKVCPSCKIGRLVVRKGKYGNFLGCNRYPECNYMESFKKKRNS